MPAGGGYAPFLHGKVVDMLYFPLIRGWYPQWFPLWGGEYFEFFRPVFNISDSSISIGVFLILIFQKRMFAEKPVNINIPSEVSDSTDNIEANNNSVQENQPASIDDSNNHTA